LATTAPQILDGYTTWFIADAVVSIVIAVIVLAVGIMYKPKQPRDGDEVILGFKWIVKGAMIGVALIVLSCNLPNLIEPRAKATHQLIRDLRGG